MAVYSNISGVGAGLIKGVDGISISKIRSINAALSSAFALLLDESYGSGAEAAYSVRRISGLYNGPLMVIRRDSDDATLEVGFNSNNDIDSSAIEVHCAGTTCYVTEWRDQSGNGNDATQSVSTSQPTIYTGGALVKENGKVALDFISDSFDFSTTITSNPLGLFSMHTDGDNQYYPLYQDADNYVYLHTNYGQLRSRIGGQFSIETYSSKNEMALRSFIQTGVVGSEAQSYVNGVDVTTTGGYAISTQQGSFTKLGNSYTGKSQEVIIYSANKSSDRTSIEENIGDYFTQNTPLLDTYSGAAAAYSLRKLSSSYSGPLVRVREDGGDTQADIYANVFGELDTVALAAHCRSNNGFVVSWVDQSGSNNNATQPADANQPKIYDGTTGVVTENGKPAVNFDGTNDQLTMSSTPLTSLTNYASFVARYTDTTTEGNLYGAQNGTNNWAITFNRGGSNRYAFRFYDGSNNDIGDNYNQAQALFTQTPTTTTPIVYKDAVAATKAYSARSSVGNAIGSRSGSYYFIGTIQEAIFYNSDQSSNRTGIESNINTFYDIFPGTELIDEYSGAAAAYSLRSLSEQYDGAVITVRRDSDDAQKNIYTLSDGQLDTSGLEGFCGKSNGFVVRWFDQSSNSNNATQTTAANQPKIYDGTTGVVTENGKPAFEFTGGTGQQLGIGSYGSTAPWTIFQIMGRTASAGANEYIGTLRANDNYFYNLNVSGSTIRLQSRANGSISSSYVTETNNLLGYHKIDGSSSEIALNGETAVTGTQAPNISAVVIGKGGAVMQTGDAFFQEYIIYKSDQSSNRTGIEENINENYLIYQPRTAPTSGLLADYSGAAAAYSLRQLSNKAVMAVKVRRDSDDAQVNIGFVGGDLDTAALSNFCGTSDGFVVQWVDQSTNGNHATQTNSANQPKIYDGSSQRVVTSNGKPAVRFINSSTTYLDAPSLGADATTTYFEVHDRNGSDTYVWSPDRNENAVLADSQTFVSGAFYNGVNASIGGSLKQPITAGDIQDYRLVYWLRNGTNSELGVNASTVVTGTQSSSVFNRLRLGTRAGLTLPFDGYMSEFVMYRNDQSSNRTGIESNIFSYYSPAPLLDTYSGAAAAYSLRKLSSSATNAVQVRRDSDDATQYIGFVQDAFNGESLDTAALSAFCGSANGFVTEWVDQSGSNNNVAQATAAAQPKIYDGTTGVVTENSKPAIYFDGTDDYFKTTTSIVQSPVTFTSVFANIPTYDFIIGSKYLAAFTLQTRVGNTTLWLGATTLSQNVAVSPNSQQVVFSAALNSTSQKLYANGSSTINTDTVSFGGTTQEFRIGYVDSNPSGIMQGYVQELIFWSAYDDTNVTTIHSDVNTYYNIY